MAKGQKKSQREAKKPKKPVEKPSGTGLTTLAGKVSGSSYKDRYRKK